jgi:hypothetical protein
MNETKPESTETVVPEVTSTAPVQESKPAAAAKTEMVTIPAADLAAVMQRIGALEESNKLFMQVQDKNKIAKIEELRRAGKLVKSVKIRKHAGKYVIAWETLQNEVYKDEQGRLIEKQTVKIFFDDGSDTDMTLRQWADASEYIPFEVTKESKNAEGDVFFTCVGPDGKTLELGASFIN